MAKIHIDNVEKFAMQLRRWSNLYKDKILFDKSYAKEKKLLETNREFKNKYKGKRCFIVGNGPSVNKIDFGQLQNELVITVNNMVRHKDYSKLNSDFHFLADPFFFKLRKQNAVEAELIEKMNLLSANNTTLFIPTYAASVVKQYGWHKNIDIHYFESGLYFYDDYREKIDFTRLIPAFQGVIHWCIAFAVYMGCKEINLLGCDSTNIVMDIAGFLNQDVTPVYAYNLSKDATELERKKHRVLGLEGTLYGYWRIVHIFSELNNYCRRNGVELYNCSEESIIESIPKRKFEDALS